MASTTTTFTPVRKPGSNPNVQRAPAGAANNKSRIFSPNTRIASSSADSRKRKLSSDSNCMDIFTRQAQRALSNNQLSAAC